MIYLSNAFSLGMLPVPVSPIKILVTFVPPQMVPVEAVSVIGHADTARIVGKILGREIVENRKRVILVPGQDILYVAQYIGPRLEIGATELPSGAQLLFYRLDINPA